MSTIKTFGSINAWDITLAPQNITELLESGHVIYFPHLGFSPLMERPQLLNADIIKPGNKNISYNAYNAELKGDQLAGEAHRKLKALMALYAKQTHGLVEQLFGQYKAHLKVGRTSYRPVEIKHRNSSYRKDDTLLHVDAFPATPLNGQRILRFFTNVNPAQMARHWIVGASIDEAINQHLPTIKRPNRLKNQWLNWLNLTKTKRSDYDHYMLNLHDSMKQNQHYQDHAKQETFNFPPGSSWLVFTDQVPHAALAGQFLLEQTFYLQPTHQKNPDTSPLYRLEKQLGRALI